MGKLRKAIITKYVLIMFVLMTIQKHYHQIAIWITFQESYTRVHQYKQDQEMT